MMSMTIKKNKLKLSALLLALSSAVFLVACGGGASEVGSDTSDAVKSSTAGTPSKASDDTCKSKTVYVQKESERKDSSKKDDDNKIEGNDDNKNCTTTSTSPATAGTPSNPASPTAAPTATGALGKATWSSICVSCHGANIGKGSNANNIMTAIANNTGGMGMLAGSVTAADANNVAEYVANPSLYP
jgi:cytochrome c553